MSAKAEGLQPSYQIFQASKPSQTQTELSLRQELRDLISSGAGQAYQTLVPTTPHPRHIRLEEDNTSRYLARPAPSFLGPGRGRPLLPLPLPQKASSRLNRATSPSTYRGTSAMSVAYEPRSFIHEGAYPPIGDEHDHGDQRFTDSEVAEHLSHYTSDAALLGDGRDIMDDGTGVQDATRLDLGATGFSSPLQVPLHAPSIPDPMPESKEPSPGIGSPPSSRIKPIPKPDRDVVKQADGKFHCPLDDCKEEVRAFSRKCEWNKHMDKHERPYRCPAAGCENLPGFTYSGGLLRHEREVHGKHGGPKNTVNCPHPNCKRHTGKGFSRQENLNEHLRRVHTNVDGTTPPADSVASPDDNESENSGMKRKRRSSAQSEELTELRDEIKRVREENEKLKTEMEQQSQHSLAMMAQIAELQDALRHGLGQHALGAPTAQMI